MICEDSHLQLEDCQFSPVRRKYGAAASSHALCQASGPPVRPAEQDLGPDKVWRPGVQRVPWYPCERGNAGFHHKSRSKTAVQGANGQEMGINPGRFVLHCFGMLGKRLSVCPLLDDDVNRFCQWASKRRKPS